MIVTCIWQFHLGQVEPEIEAPDLIESVFKELVAVEASELDLSNSAVTLDQDTMIVNLSITADQRTYEEAVTLAMSAIRWAIHAAGGSTPDWASDDHTHAISPQFDPKDMHATV